MIEFLGDLVSIAEKGIQCRGLRDIEREVIIEASQGLVRTFAKLDKHFIAPHFATAPAWAAEGYRILYALVFSTVATTIGGLSFPEHAEFRLRQSLRGKWERPPPLWEPHAEELLRSIEDEGNYTTPPKIAGEIHDRRKLDDIEAPEIDTLTRWIRKQRKIGVEPGSPLD